MLDFDIDPATRELRRIPYSGTNFRYSLNTFELHVDQPLDTPGRYEALAHPPLGSAHGGETLAIYYPTALPTLPRVADPARFDSLAVVFPRAISISRAGGPDRSPPVRAEEAVGPR